MERLARKNILKVWPSKLMILLVGLCVVCFSVINPAGTGEARSADGLISIDYTDANLSSVLKALAYSNELNLVMTKDIQGVVSANLQEVTIEEALHAILSVNGYTFVREGKLIYVVPGAGL